MAGGSELSASKRLANRMRAYEADFEDSITSEVPAILRCDGHSFSRIAQSFTKPFDQRYHNAMVETAMDLLQAHPAATIAYTASDEITLVFPNGLNAFNNRIQKIASIAAGQASVRFYVHMLREIEAGNVEDEREEAEGRKRKHKAVNAHGLEQLTNAHFDARIYAVPDIDEAVNCLVWRCRGDAMRNSINAFARMHFHPKRLFKKNAFEVKEMLRRERKLIFEESVPPWAVEGSLIKRHMVEIEGLNPRTGQTEKAWRTKMVVLDRGITQLTPETINLVKAKYHGTVPIEVSGEAVEAESGTGVMENEDEDVEGIGGSHNDVGDS